MSKTYWLIRGYEGSTKIYERRIDSGQMTISQGKDLLKALVAKAGLTFDEIVGAYATRRTKIANDHLLVRSDGSSPTFYCGSNPHFVIAIAKMEGERLVILSEQSHKRSGN